MDGVIGFVILFDDSNKIVLIVVVFNLLLVYVEVVEGVEVGLWVGFCGIVIFSKKNVFVLDMFDSDLWFDFVDFIV